MNFLSVALLFCILANAFASHYEHHHEEHHGHHHPSEEDVAELASAARDSAVQHYLAREKFRSKVRHALVRDDIRRNLNRHELRKAARDFLEQQ
ncbi:unnamed protein product [Caenorhabditis sp. 36 PRJEB53466]|nr:unnamed protein product [Caenorhabditis sp. 36 PRJEB53466]